MNQILKITLAQVPHTPLGELSSLSPDHLLSLQQQAEENLQRAKFLKDWLDSSILLKYREVALSIRKLEYKDTGTVHFTDGDYKITSVLPKKIEWDQRKLKDVFSAIKEHGDNPSEYVETSFKVLENKYSAWPEHIKSIFKPARIFKLGKESFKIEAAAKEVNHE